MDWLDFHGAAQQGGSHPITEAIMGRIEKELLDMARDIGISPATSPFSEIRAEADCGDKSESAFDLGHQVGAKSFIYDGRIMGGGLC